MVITHDDEKVKNWENRGAKNAVADVVDSDKLREVFDTGTRLFLLNPPAKPSTDTVAEEHKTLTAILKALENSGIKKVVAESTYGAQSGEGVGDLGVLFEMEERLKKMNLSATIIRAAYYMSNWDTALETAKKEGKIYTLYPADFKLPMVAPQDIGEIAAKLLSEPLEKTGLHYVEGPETYSSNDVAEAFGKALDKTVKAVETPKDNRLDALKQIGFSEKAAKSMSAMTEVTLEQKYEQPQSPMRGATTINQYVENLVSKENEKS